MKTLYLVRHAKAIDAKAGINDFDRVLTVEGQEQAQEVAKTLNKDMALVDIILASPAARAISTAEIIAKGLHHPTNQIKTIPKMFQPSLDDLIEIIVNIDPQNQYAMLVGHNPTISQLAQFLCYSVQMDLSPCGVIALTFDMQSWDEVINHRGTLLYIIQPK